WAGVGAPPPPSGAIGLKHFDVRLPDAAAIDAVVERIRAANIPLERGGGAVPAVLVSDPAGNVLRLTSADIF
ncbi:MAG TPA: hypothetical protein VIW45_05400, partial [Vicinamibacterales bacterium]